MPLSLQHHLVTQYLWLDILSSVELTHLWCVSNSVISSPFMGINIVFCPCYLFL